MRDLKEALAEQVLENRLLKKEKGSIRISQSHRGRSRKVV